MTSFGVVSIATGSEYWIHWSNQVKSFRETTSNFSQIQFYLLTDNPKEAVLLAKNLEMRLKVFKIPSYGWPEATLLRYREISKVKESLIEEVIIYLDADMLIRRDFFRILKPAHWLNGVALVAHPGYWRPRGVPKITFYFANPQKLFSDIYNWIIKGGLGSWEKRKVSTAFVPRNKRETYVCGGTWMGLRMQFFKMVEECEKSVDLDLENNLVAIWHDESYLNKWKSKNPTSILNPSFCFDPTYPQLRNLPEYIRAVQK